MERAIIPTERGGRKAGAAMAQYNTAPSVPTIAKRRRKGRISLEGAARSAFLAAALVGVGLVAAVAAFIIAGGIPTLHRLGIIPFVTGRIWRPEQDVFGILPMTAGSFAITGTALVLSLPMSLMAAVFIARYASPRLAAICTQAVAILASIPSVVYGYFGLVAVVPSVAYFAGGSGASVLAAGIVLAMMISPTIVSVSSSSILAVPSLYIEGAQALGATRERGIFTVELRAASSGIVSAILLAMSRAIGETMAVIMVAGNQCAMPRSILRGSRTLTANIALEMGYAAGAHRGALMATAVVLFVLSLVINAIFMFAHGSMGSIIPKALLGKKRRSGV